MNAPRDDRRTVLITGCSSGVGAATAAMLQKRGWRVFATARKLADVERLKALGYDALTLDVAEPASVAAAVAEVTDRSGGHLDALVNNAGIAVPGAVEDLDRAALLAQFEPNLFGAIELTHHVMPLMRPQGHGRIVMISSVLGLVSMPWRGAYCASKFALEAITDSLRMELRGSGISVSLVEPGPIESRFRDHSIENFDHHVGAEASAHRETYARLRAHTGAGKNREPFTLPPEAVARRIVHALESPRPKRRYYVTFPAYLMAFLRRILPAAVLDTLLSRA